LSIQQLITAVGKKVIAVGDTAHFTSVAGGGEGTPFRINCPPGFVVTGLKGKAVATGGIQELQLVCSPLEVR
jgi:hypothetical protein